MAETVIRDYKAETVKICKELEKLVHEIGGDNYSKQIREIKEKINKSEPSLMFYGIYNAGKSTLLNAVFGKEVASMNDIPETHKVTLYPWGKYTLVDTPGLNGPPEDEIITTEEVKKHDIIMFVIDDSDNFDSDVITKKIIEILETGKPCIIVINKKNASDKEHILAIKAKMSRNIRELSSVLQKYEFVDVDAAAALKAKQENKDILLADSNIKELEYCISKKLASVDSVMLLGTPLEMMTYLCGDIQEFLEKDESDGEAKRFQRLKKDLYQTKEQIKREFSIAFHQMADKYADNIYYYASMNRQSDIRKEDYEREIQNLASGYMEKFAKESNSVIRQFAADYRMSLDLPEIPEKTKSGDIKSKTGDKDEIDEFLDVIGDLPIIIEVPTPTPIPIPLPVIIAAIKMFKKWVFGSSSESQANTEELNRQQEENAQKRIMALQELKNQIFIQMDSFKKQVVNNFESQLEAVYMERDANIERAMGEQEEQSADRMKKQEKVMEIKNNADRLLKEIR